MTLHYDRLGQGPHVLLAFHGAGQTGRECFQSFADHLGSYYTIYAFDLFFHGQSQGLHGTEHFTDKEVVHKQAWKEFIQSFLVENQIDRFNVAGFSLGGRFALATAEAFPTHINSLFLIAPDGVVEHPLYHVATRFAPTRWLYKRLAMRPAPLFMAATLAEKSRLLPTRTVRFVRHMLETPQQRQRIYRSWVSFRGLSFSIGPLYQQLRQNRVDVWLFVGKYDPMLPARQFRILTELMPATRYILLESGHTRLVEKAAAYLAGFLK